MKRLLAISALMACMAGPAAASVMGEDACEGLGVHAAWLDWGTGKVSVAVFNHTGDGRWPARTKRFRVAYEGASTRVASEEITLRSLNPRNIELFDYKKLVGQDFGAFNGERMLARGDIRLTGCKNVDR